MRKIVLCFFVLNIFIGCNQSIDNEPLDNDGKNEKADILADKFDGQSDKNTDTDLSDSEKDDADILVCEENEERNTERECGLNNEGFYVEKCIDGAWKETEKCTGTDECVNDTERNSDEKCGLNNNGVIIEKCENGKWTKTAECKDPDECKNDSLESGTTPCGFNNNGFFEKKCVDGEWVETDKCNDPDNCVNGSSQDGVIECGMNGRGAYIQECIQGQWNSTSICKDPDECVDHSDENKNERNTGTACGLNTRGFIVERCIEGAWTTTGTCNDPDECVDHTNEATNERDATTVCGFNDRGHILERCVSGNWEVTEECNDPDECEDTQERDTTTACGFNDRGFIQERCNSGTWEITETCVDPDECVDHTNETPNERDTESVCGFNDRGYFTERCIAGNWQFTFECNDPDECLDDSSMFEENVMNYCLSGEWNVVMNSTVPDIWIESAESVAVDSNGNIFVTNTIAPPYAVVRKYDNNMNYLWQKSWVNTELSVEHSFASSISVDSSNNLYITGTVNKEFDSTAEVFVSKLDNDGNHIWTETWGEGAAKDVVVDSIGNVYVNGYIDSVDNLDGNINVGAADIFLTKFNNSGIKQWTKIWGDDEVEREGWSASALVTDNAGYLYMTGRVHGVFNGMPTAENDTFVMKVDSDGNEVRTELLGDSSWDGGRDIALDNTGNIYVLAREFDFNDNPIHIDALLYKVNASGEKVWTQRLRSDKDDDPSSLVIDTSGNIYISGYSSGALKENYIAESKDAFLAKYSSSGEFKWLEMWAMEAGESNPSEDVCTSMVIDLNGNIFTTGYTGISYNYHMFINKWFADVLAEIE